MIQKIKNLALALSLVLTFGGSMFATAPAYAAYPDSPTPAICATTPTTSGCPQSDLNKTLCNGSNFDVSGDTTKSTDCTGGETTLSTKIKKVLNILSAFIGIIAVIMIIYAGFRYVSSAGGEAGVKAAKNAIVYAIIGLIVVALAQIIVHFVISSATGA